MDDHMLLTERHSLGRFIRETIREPYKEVNFEFTHWDKFKETVGCILPPVHFI